MDIYSVFPPYIYSIGYGDGDGIDEYNRLMGLWQGDVSFLYDYFASNCSRMDPGFWGNIAEPEIAAGLAYEEAYELDALLGDISLNIAQGRQPDYDSIFKPLDGEFIYEWKHTPMKAYGTHNPSLLRLYAIKMGPNCYLITGGGIKICRTMQEDPELLKELMKISKVRSFLRELGIENQDDFLI